MKTITTNKAVLIKAVATAANFTQRDGDFPGKIEIVGQDGAIEVKASNGVESVILKDISFTSSDLTDVNFKAFSIDAKKLLTTLKAAKTDEVQFELHSEHIVAKSGRSRVKIETLAQTQEIQIPSEGKNIDLTAHINEIKKVLHSVDSNNPKYELNGMLFQQKNGLFSIVGTDTKRLTAASNSSEVEDFEIIVPKVGVQNIIKIFDGHDVTAKVLDTKLIVTMETISYSTKLIGGKFPEWQRIVPQTFSQKFTMPAVLLKSLVEDASLFIDEIVIEIKENSIKLRDFERNTQVEEEIETGNTNMRFGIRANSFIDFINSMDGEKVQICFNDNNTPIMIVESPEYSEIIMPLILLESEEVQDAA